LVYCSVIDSCWQVFALRRASEWTSALARFCDEQPDMVAFTGPCLVHRAELLELSGAWSDAIQEARRASDNRTNSPQTVLAALCRLGELYRLQGDFVAAEQAYREASQLGFEPPPGLAALRLAQKRPEAALVAIRRALKLTSAGWPRTRLLPDYVEILLANAELEEARRACDELDAIARTRNSRLLTALAAQARGALELAEGRAEAALLPLRSAGQAWQELDAPYLVARVRARMGLCYRALGDEEGSALELAAARSVFERLGAAPDLAELDALVRQPARADRHALTARELEVLRLIAGGSTNKAIAVLLFVSERTVDRHVSNILAKLAVSSRAAATAFAYEHRLF
jgi:ATP/maltotriose-dependent transcriptional regulator MalT